MDDVSISTPTLTALLIDDDDVAVEGIIRSFKKCGLPWTTVTAEDGQEALDILRGLHPRKHIQAPHIILLDLNMPRMGGFEFLNALRADAKLHSSVVFVLTTSGRDIDRMRAYQDNIAGYMVKSAVGPHFLKLTSLLKSYGQTIQLPERLQ